MLRSRIGRLTTRGKAAWLIAILLAVALTAFAGCQSIARTSASGAPIAAANSTSVAAANPTPAGLATPVYVDAKPKSGATQDFTAKLQFTPPKAEVGQMVNVTGSGYPSGADVELVYYTVDGRYELEGGTEFVGQRYTERSEVIAKLLADQSGNISARIETPLDFGGAHDIRGRVAGKEISQASLTINPTFSVNTDKGPVGTLIELKIVGVDYRTSINTWHVMYDNQYLGFMSAVTTKGVSIGRIRAAGSVGDHLITIWHNSFYATPYLNFQQGPYKDVPNGAFTFKVTPGSVAAGPTIEDYSAADNPQPVKSEGPGKLALSRDRGQVGQATTVKGSALPRNSNVTLAWTTMVGNRVSAIGFSEDVRPIATVTTSADGSFAYDWAIPDDLGGQHQLRALVDGRVLAATGLVIQPSVVTIAPTKVRAGEQVVIHLKGVGWTTYENTYSATYDNSYIGYVCGFSTNGDVQFSVTATGGPGMHIVDLYPTIYKGQDPQPRVYSVPQLSYATDHPQRITPAIRLAFEVTD